MPSSTSTAARVKSPSTRSTGAASSIDSAMFAATSGGSSGTRYSSVKSSIVRCQLISFTCAAFQKIHATLKRSGSASSEKGTDSSQARRRSRCFIGRL